MKGSGWSLDSIEPAGFPLIELEHLYSMIELEEISDISMARELRTRLLDPDSPGPSVESLTHALLPGKFVDHSHANVMCALTDRAEEDARRIAEELYGPKSSLRLAIVPYAMPGFDLAKAARDAFRANPNVHVRWN